MLHDKSAGHQHQVPWGIIAVAMVGGILFALIASVIVYKVVTSRNDRRGRGRQVTSTKSRKVTNNTNPEASLIKKNQPGSITMNSRYINRRNTSPDPILPNQERDMTVPQKPMCRSPTFEKDIDPNMIKTEVYEIDESTGLCKSDSLREKGIDDLKQPKLGTLYFSVSYDDNKSELKVSIWKMCDLPARNSNQETSDPYIKLQLSPDKSLRAKTKVIRKTLNPVYDEVFTFYHVDNNQLPSITLHFVVLSFDRFSRDDIIGEVLYPLYSIENLTFNGKEVALCKEIAPRHQQIEFMGRGEMLVSLCYTPAVNRLTVVILKARNLPKMDIAGLADPYVKIYLLYNGQRLSKKKTHVKKRTLDPVFNQSFLFDVPCNEGLQNISLELQVLDWDRMTKNEVIGRIEIGAHCTDKGGKHWNEVMNCPRKQLADWHELK